MKVRRNSVAALVVAISLCASACSDDTSTGDAQIQDALEQATVDALADRGAVLEGDLKCLANVAEDGGIAGACSGTDGTGAAVATTFSGVRQSSDSSCSGTLVVKVGDETFLDDAAFDCSG